MTAITTAATSSGRRKSAWELREEAKRTGWEHQQKEPKQEKLNQPQHEQQEERAVENDDNNKENDQASPSASPAVEESPSKGLADKMKKSKKSTKRWKRPKPGAGVDASLPPAFQMAFATHNRLSSNKSRQQKEDHQPIDTLPIEVVDIVFDGYGDEHDDDEHSTQRIRFEKSHIKYIECDYTHEEKFAYWFQDHEFDRMKKRDRSISKKIARGETNGRNYCTHGLMDDNYREERRARIEDNIYNVLTEQENQRQSRDVKRSKGLKVDMSDYCWDSISNMSLNDTQYDLTLAHERALQHSMEINVDMSKVLEEETCNALDDDTVTVVTATTTASNSTFASSKTDLIDDMLELSTSNLEGQMEPTCVQ